MVTVPTYERNVSTRPIFQQGVDVRASPEAFGASVGRGMQQAAQGLGNLSDSMAAVKELEDVARAKEADNSYADWMRNRMYGDGGYMTQEGRNAVDGRSAFEQEAEKKRKEFGKDLTPGAARAYQTASQARLQSVYQQSIVHSASERKKWFADASNSRVETFANDALVNFNKPDLVTKNLAAGIMEIREQGQLHGWDADTLKAREADFASGVHKNITLRMAQDDPLAADAYMKSHAKQMSGADQYSLAQSLETEIASAQSMREADAILSSGRTEHADERVAPAGSSQAGRTLGSGGPTKVRGFLQSRAPGKGASAIDLLDESFATNLAALIQDAPPRIREGLQIMSGARTHARQKELFANSDRSGRMVARPGHSNHEVRADGTAKAVDLMWNGLTLKSGQAPKDVIDYVHQNARKYGMYFPMSWEDWHIEPLGTRGSSPVGSAVAPSSNRVAPRSTMPSYDDIEGKLANITDDKVRDLTRKRIYAAIEVQSKATEQQEKAAKAELWKYVDQGSTPDQIPMEVRQAAGMAAVSSAWSYMETAAKGRAVESDETLTYDMRRYAASNPTEFASVDLNDYRDRLSKETIKELTGLQTTALTDQRKANEDGLNLTTAFSQAQSQLEAVGITTTGKEGSAREEEAKRIAQFQNALASQMDEFKRANNDKAPTQMDIQSMVNRLLLPVVIKTPGVLWGTNETPALMFEAGARADASTVDVAVKYSDIPIDLRRGIALDLERDLGRKPSEDEIVQRYEDFVLSR